MKLKILFLNHNIWGRGTFLRCFHFAKHLVRFGHSVVILTSAPSVSARPMRSVETGVEIISFPDFMSRRMRNGGFGPIDTLFRCLYILHQRFDVIENYDHRPVVLYPAILWRLLLKRPLVSEWTDLHGTGGSLSKRPKILQGVMSPFENFTERKSKLIADRLVVISRWLGRKAQEIGVPESRITYIPGGADIDSIKPLHKAEARKRFGLPEKGKIIGYTAGTPYDIDLFLDAIGRIQEENTDAILFTTGVKFGPELKRRLVDPKRFLEFGFLPYDEYASILPAADIFLFPFPDNDANRGRWPNKVGDYMAAGRPTVSNRTGEIVDLFETYRIGFLARDDAADLADKALALLSNEAVCADMGNNARQAAERYYDWRLLSRKLERCLLSAAEIGAIGGARNESEGRG